MSEKLKLLNQEFKDSFNDFLAKKISKFDMVDAIVKHNIEFMKAKKKHQNNEYDNDEMVDAGMQIFLGKLAIDNARKSLSLTD